MADPLEVASRVQCREMVGEGKLGSKVVPSLQEFVVCGKKHSTERDSELGF